MKKRFLVVRLRFALSSSSIFPRSLLYFFSLISPFPPSLSSSFPFSASLFSSSSIHPPPNHPPFLHHYLFSTSLPFKWFFPPFVASSISRCFFFSGQRPSIRPFVKLTYHLYYQGNKYIHLHGNKCRLCKTANSKQIEPLTQALSHNSSK